MAKSEHLAKFKEGVNVWNKWREKNPDIKPDLSNADLRKTDVVGADFSYTNLIGVNFMGTDLRRANFIGANLSNADLRKANFESANLCFSSEWFVGNELRRFVRDYANFTNAKITGANLTYANFKMLQKGVTVWNEWREKNRSIKIDLREVHLEGSDLKGFKLYNCDFRNASFKKVDLQNCDLYHCDFMSASIRDSNLKNTDLQNSEFQNAQLSNVDLKGADMHSTQFFCAQLTNIDLRDAYLSNSSLEWANLTNAQLQGANLEFANLSHAKLTTSQLQDSSLRGIRAVYTNFKSAILTGACIQDWNINNQTNLEDVKCDYIYLKLIQEEKKWIFGDRRPHDPNKIFAQGEFTKLFQKAQETLDLLFQNGANWQAVAYSLDKVSVHNKNTPLTIQKIENKGDGDVLISVNVPEDVKKGKIEGDFWQGYEFTQKQMEGQFQARIEDKDQEINRLFYTVNEQRKLIGDRNITVNNGNYNEEIQGNYYQTAAEIKQLLDQLQQTNGVTLETSQQQTAKDLANKANSDPQLKDKLINLSKFVGENSAKTLVGEGVKGVLKLLLFML